MTATDALKLITIITLSYPHAKFEQEQIDYWISRFEPFDYGKSLPRLQRFCDTHVGPPPSLAEILTAMRGGNDIERMQAAQQAIAQDFTGIAARLAGQTEPDPDRAARIHSQIAAMKERLDLDRGIDPLQQRFTLDAATPEQAAIIDRRKRLVLEARKRRDEKRRDPSLRVQLEKTRREIARRKQEEPAGQREV